MKKIQQLLLSALAIASVTASNAQVSIPFDVKTPKWTKIACGATADGANVRKSPSASAPRLMYDEYGVAYDVPFYLQGEWSTRQTTQRWQPVKFTDTDYAIVAGEKDGWVELEGWAPSGAGSGWVSGKYCKVDNIKPIVPTECSTLLMLGGSLEDYAVFAEPNEMDQTLNFYVGRLINGILVCPYTLFTDWETTGSKTYISVKNENGVKTFITYFNNFMNENYRDFTKADISNEMLKTIMENAQFEDLGVTYFYNNGDYIQSMFIQH